MQHQNQAWDFFFLLFHELFYLYLLEQSIYLQLLNNDLDTLLFLRHCINDNLNQHDHQVSLEGVPTAIKIASDPLIDFFRFVSKTIFLKIYFFQVHQDQVQKLDNTFLRLLILLISLSTQVTFTPNSAKHVPETSPT